jgi:antirestriction protein ArdC
MAQNFAAPVWMTFKQASELDAHIRKGEKGSLVVYADSIKRKETDEKTGDEIDWEIPFLKGYTVFNVEQIEGLPEVCYAKAEPTLDPVTRIEHAERFFAALGATIRHGGNRAFYSNAADVIQMPPFESFQDANSYYVTLAHECTHWTGSKTRLDRDFGGHRFGSEGYAVEELVAELGAAFLCADLELALEPREDHASYIATWLKMLATDNRAVFTAAAHAQRAAELSTTEQPPPRKLSPRLARHDVSAETSAPIKNLHRGARYRKLAPSFIFYSQTEKLSEGFGF